MIICRLRQRSASFSCHYWDLPPRPISKSLSPAGLARLLTRTGCQPNRRSRRSTRPWFNVSTAPRKTTAHARSSRQRSSASLAAAILTMIMARWPDAFSRDFVGAPAKLPASGSACYFWKTTISRDLRHDRPPAGAMPLPARRPRRLLPPEGLRAVPVPSRAEAPAIRSASVV